MYFVRFKKCSIYKCVIIFKKREWTLGVHVASVSNHHYAVCCSCQSAGKQWLGCSSDFHPETCGENFQSFVDTASSGWTAPAVYEIIKSEKNEWVDCNESWWIMESPMGGGGAGAMGENLYPSVTMKVGKLFIDPQQENTDGGHSWSLFLCLDFALSEKSSLNYSPWKTSRRGLQTHSAARNHLVRHDNLNSAACIGTRASFLSVQLCLWTLGTLQQKHQKITTCRLTESIHCERHQKDSGCKKMTLWGGGFL